MNNVFVDFLLANLAFTIITAIILLGIIIDSILLIVFSIKENKKRKLNKN